MLMCIGKPAEAQEDNVISYLASLKQNSHQKCNFSTARTAVSGGNIC